MSHIEMWIIVNRDLDYSLNVDTIGHTYAEYDVPNNEGDFVTVTVQFDNNGKLVGQTYT